MRISPRAKTGEVSDGVVVSLTDITHLKSREDRHRTNGNLLLTRIKRQVLETGTGARGKVRTTIDGVPFYYDLMVEPLLDLDSDVVGISCTSIEISQDAFEQDKQSYLR